MMRAWKTTSSSGLLVSLAVLCCAPASHGQSPSECRVAQVLAIAGDWVAEPGGRNLQKWACLNAGDEVRPKSSRTADLTIIYRDGNLAPHTESCTAQAPCRNAYKVLTPSATPARQSVFQELLNLFFSHPAPKAIPGVLFGRRFTERDEYLSARNAGGATAATGLGAAIGGIAGGGRGREGGIAATGAGGKPPDTETSDVRYPVLVLCRDGETVDLKDALGAEPTTVQLAPIAATKAVSASDPTIELPLNNIYRVIQTNTRQITSIGTALIEPLASCGGKQEALANAVRMTQSWPKEISESVRRDFVVAYLHALATSGK